MTHRHFLIYKPYRMVSQFISNDKHQRKKRFLGELYDFPEGLMAVGRLDETSEGLLLLTTDGSLSHQINTSKIFDKEYIAQVDGTIDSIAISKLSSGVEIKVNKQLYLTKPCAVYQLVQEPNFRATQQKIRDDRHGPTSYVSIALKEGKFRQVRKMTSAVGFPTLRLVRVRIGNYTVEDLKGKQVLEVTDEELRKAIS